MKRRSFLLTAGLGSLGLGSVMGKTPEIALKRRTQKIKTKVLVVGGGPAGIGAAVGSALNGVDTLILENYGFFGGVASWGLGMVMNQMRPNEEERGIVHTKLREKLEAYGPQAVRLTTHQFRVNVDYLKAAILDLFDETGVKYLVHSKVVDVIMKRNRITGVIISTKSGLTEVHADVVIDCTGDADVSYFAGAPTMKEVGNFSPQTLHLNLSNIDSYEREDLKEVGKLAQEKYPLVPPRWGMYKVSNAHHYIINHSGTKNLGNFDITDIHQFSEAECLSRRQVIQMTQAMREFGGGDVKNTEITGASPQIGVRESRRIKGAYILSEDDAIKGARFEDAIAWRSGWLDIGFVRVSQMKIHQVPYRAIIPDNVEGLLAAGRCISATHEGASAGKSMGNCFATGHAAGVAASLASKEGKMPRELKVEKIQKILTTHDVDLNKGGEEQSEDMAN